MTLLPHDKMILVSNGVRYEITFSKFMIYYSAFYFILVGIGFIKINIMLW